MQLLYLWLENYNNIQNQGFNFSPDFHIEYKKETNQLEIAKKENILPANFFGEKVTSVTAIVGKNGTGKSSILAAICYFLANTVGKPLDNEIQNRIVICFLKGENTISCFDGVIQNDACYPRKQKNEVLTCSNQNYKIEDITEPEEFKKNLLGLLYAVQTTIEYLNVAEKSMLFLTEQGLMLKGTLNNVMSSQRPFLYANWKKSIDNKMIFNFWKQFRFGKKLGEPSLWPKDLPYTPKISLAMLPNDTSYYKATESTDKILKYFISAMDDYFVGSRDGSHKKLYFQQIKNKVNNIIRTTKNFTKEAIKAIFQDNDTSAKENDEDISLAIALEEKFRTFFANLMKFIDAANKTKNYKLKFENLYLNLDFLENADLAKQFIELLRETETFLPNFFVIEPEEKYSSGQLVMLNMLSRLYWQVDAEKLKEKTHILLMIDEGEITLHPEWQRNYFSRLLEVCELLNANVQLILTTHSPFLLSDIPKENVIFLLDKNDKKHELEHTFAANIHTMLSNSFFMNGVIGDFAKDKIQKVIKRLSLEENDETMDLDDCKRIIDLIAEPILRNKLNEMYLMKRYPNQRIMQLDEQIKELQRQKDKLNENNPK